jgi:hypothetical protein
VDPDSDAPRPESSALGPRSPAGGDVDPGDIDADDVHPGQADPDAWAFDDEPGEGPEPGDGPEDGPHTALPPKLEAWRKRSATGAVLTGFALGLQQAFEKEREQPAIVMQTSGDPPKDLPVEADVQHGRPRHSVVSIRPWLLSRRAKDVDADAPDAAGGPGTAGQTGAGPPEDR